MYANDPVDSELLAPFLLGAIVLGFATQVACVVALAWSFTLDWRGRSKRQASERVGHTA